MHSFPYELYLVISEADCNGKNMLHVAEEALKGGVDIIQLREKNSTFSSFLDKALRLKELTEKYSVPLIINDNLAIAQETDAYGVHVGNSDIPPVTIRKEWSKIIGYSIELFEQVSNEQAIVSDYLGISPVFSTKTKTDTVTEWGLEGIRKIRAATNKPLVAIGGINLQNAKPIIKEGADCLAVVSAICGADNPQKAAFNLRTAIRSKL